MRLTNTIKDQILKNIIFDAFSGREKAIAKVGTQLADDIYSSYYNQYKAKMDALPETFFISKRSIMFNIDGYCHTLEMSNTRLFAQCHNHGYIMIYDPDLAKRFKATYKDQTELDKDIKELRSKVMAIVSSATTDKELVEAWPEAEKYIPLIIEPKPSLLIGCCSHLNGLIASMKGEVEHA